MKNELYKKEHIDEGETATCRGLFFEYIIRGIPEKARRVLPTTTLYKKTI